MLSSGIGAAYDPRTGRGVIGKNFCLQVMSSVQLFVEDEINPFIGTGVNPACARRFPRRQFRPYGAWAFLAAVICIPRSAAGRPIQVRAVPPGTPALGLAVEGRDHALVQSHLPRSARMGASYAWRTNYLDLDPELQRCDRAAAGAHDL
jgi:gluconate 2-dehydrogenase alpha chain